jgi:hypothetical protein
MLYQFRTPRKKTGVLSAFGGSLIIAIAILVTTISLFGDWWGYMIEYHSHRGIQIESVYATIIMLVSYVGIDSTISHQYGASRLQIRRCAAGDTLDLVAASGDLLCLLC